MLTRRTLLAIMLALLASLLPACGGDSGTTGNAGSPAAMLPQPTPTNQPASTATPTVVLAPTTPAAAVDATSTIANASPSVATAGLTDDVVMVQWTSQIVVVNADGSGSRALTDGQTPDGGTAGLRMAARSPSSARGTAAGST
ncbi:MAG TPA: hypothetical protein PKA95_11085 [Thermomicrobiales bacterium]|nr:hypothetical protein [Thermomicrobiales bacterium]